MGKDELSYEEYLEWRKSRPPESTIDRDIRRLKLLADGDSEKLIESLESYLRTVGDDYAKAIAALKWIGGVDESKPYCTYYERTLDDGTTVPTTTGIAEAVLKELGELE